MKDEWTWLPDNDKVGGVATYKLSGLPEDGLTLRFATFAEARAMYVSLCNVFRAGIDCGMDYLKNSMMAAASRVPREVA